jgi:hypothetical protein
MDAARTPRTMGLKRSKQFRPVESRFPEAVAPRTLHSSCAPAGFPPAVPCDFPGHDRFVPPDRGSHVLIPSPFASDGKCLPRLPWSAASRAGPRFLLSSRVSRELFTTGRSSPAAPDSDVKSMSPVKPDCLDRSVIKLPSGDRSEQPSATLPAAVRGSYHHPFQWGVFIQHKPLANHVDMSRSPRFG